MQTEITPGCLASQGFSPSTIDRFWKHVNKTNSCWIWTASRNNQGYGVIGKGARGSGTCLAHRLSYIIHVGPIPEGMNILHDCPDGDNPLCVNPEHLWAGTQIENIMDMVGKGRWGVRNLRKGSTHPHSKLTEQQIFEIRSSKEKQVVLADRYGVEPATIWKVIHNQSWIMPQ